MFVKFLELVKEFDISMYQSAINWANFVKDRLNFKSSQSTGKGEKFSASFNWSSTLRKNLFIVHYDCYVTSNEQYYSYICIDDGNKLQVINTVKENSVLIQLCIRPRKKNTCALKY